MSQTERLFTGEFLALNGVAFLTFCNMAVFFQFYEYLQTMPIAPEWFGFLIALFSITGLLLRPVISPLLHSGNARLWMLVSAAGVAVSLVGYNLAGDLWSMSLIRAIHGIAYVALGVALNAALVDLIPASRSGQAFGLVTVITLLPFAVVPPVLNGAEAMLGGFVPVLNVSAVLMLLVFPLSFALKAPRGHNNPAAAKALGLRELKENFRNRKVSVLLLIMLLLYTSFTPVFFFLADYGKKLGIANPGLFFTLSTLSEIGVRLIAGPLFDRVNKVALIGGSLVAVTLGYAALAHLSGAAMFYGLGVFLGLAWGVVMPVLNALMFDISPAHLKGLNTNLGVQMFQGGFFIGPFLGGLVLARAGFPGLFYLCALFALAGLALTPLLAARERRAAA